ncbi:hypothetical protein ACJJTC_014544, partial [Scirpophaga incertulas]
DSFQGATTTILKYIDEIDNIASFNDAQHRGPAWEHWSSSMSNYDDDSPDTSATSSVTSSEHTNDDSSSSSAASSVETKERKRATQTFRTCTPCPHDMLKKYNNIGIKWICARYQRARRTFKSDCMMRYRNCQDGTIDTVRPDISNVTTVIKHNLDVEAINKKLNNMIEPNEIKLENKGKSRRKLSKRRSTSSSSAERVVGTESASDESLKISSSGDNSSSETEKKKKLGDRPESSVERHGWRKWHRKCTVCPEDMAMKWRDPRINWICGGYQRARRSFKSLCMMHYRNCQDGT